MVAGQSTLPQDPNINPSNVVSGSIPGIPNYNQATQQALLPTGQTLTPGQYNAAAAGQANTPIGSQKGYTYAAGPPLTQGQQAALFTPVNQPQIASNINTAFNVLSNQAAPQVTGSPLAGVTTLGNVANAGIVNAGGTNINTGTSNQLTNAQLAQINALNATAQGQGPNPVAIQAQQQAQQNTANQYALIASQRGASNPALGLRNAGEAAAAANQNAAVATAAGTAQQELNAQNALTGALQGTQGQVMQGAQAQAGLNQNINLANAAAGNQIGLANAGAQNTGMLTQGQIAQQTALANQGVVQQSALANLGTQAGTQGLNTQEYNAALQAQIAQATNQQTANMNYANMVTGENNVLAGLAQNQAINQTNNQLGLIGAGISGGGAALGALALASDRRLKVAIRSANRSMKDFLSKVSVPQSSFNLIGG